MTETKPALVNFTVETFTNERDMEFHLAQASKRFEVFMPRFKEAGLKKITSTKIWKKKARRWLGGCLSMKTLKHTKHASLYGKRLSKP